MYSAKRYCNELNAAYVYEVIFSEESSEFGLKVYTETSSHHISDTCIIPSISPSYSLVQALCIIMEDNLVSPLHTRDIVEDFLCN